MDANTTWGRTETGFVYHSFNADGTAICRKNIKAADGRELFTEAKVDEMLAEAWGIRTIGYRKCTGCETREAARRDRLAASLAPSTGEGDYLPPAETVAAEPTAQTAEAPAPADAPKGPYSGNEYIHNLHLGDMFRFPGDPHMIYGPVTGTTSSYDLGWTKVTFAKGVDPVERHAFTRVEVTQRGPRCECRRPYDICEQGCEWPDDVEKLWAASF